MFRSDKYVGRGLGDICIYEHTKDGKDLLMRKYVHHVEGFCKHMLSHVNMFIWWGGAYCASMHGAADAAGLQTASFVGPLPIFEKYEV